MQIALYVPSSIRISDAIAILQLEYKNALVISSPGTLTQELLDTIDSSTLLLIEAFPNISQYRFPGDVIILFSRFGSNEMKVPIYRLLGSEIQLTGEVVKLQLSDRQYAEYLLREQRESGYENFSALQTLNFVYPEPLQEEHNKPRKSRKELPPDLPKEEGGWIGIEEYAARYQFSSKIPFVIEMVQRRKKYVLLTHFTESNGVSLIATYLRYAKIPVMTITGADGEHRKERWEIFNRVREGVMITNMPALGNLDSVGAIILFEQHKSPSLLESYLRNYTGTIIHIISLIAVGPHNEETLDGVYYENFSSRFNSKQGWFDQHISTWPQLK